MNITKEEIRQVLGALHADPHTADWDDAITLLQNKLAEVDTSEVCPICGEGKATLMVLRTCDNCNSEYAGSAELLLAKTHDDTALLRQALGQLECNTENMSKGMSKSIQKLCARENREVITALRERLGDKTKQVLEKFEQLKEVK